RPARTARTGAGTVEIQVDTRLLNDLATDPHKAGPWPPIIAELLKHAATPRDNPHGDRDKRLPGRSLRRFVYVRDRECVFPGCRIPALSHGHGSLRRLREGRTNRGRQPGTGLPTRPPPQARSRLAPRTTHTRTP